MYEIGFWVEPTYFVPRYIGRARGRLDGDLTKRSTTIRSRLRDHFSERGNKGIAAALGGKIHPDALWDPDYLSEGGRQKMVIDKNLYCRWMVTSVAVSREARVRTH